jgi:hypothetical protein
VAGKQSPDRDQQFRYIGRWRQAYLRRHWPVISVDAKKRELIGNFKQAGTEWRQQRREVNMYDFLNSAKGKAIPYGIYDIGHNQGYVVVGTSHDTAEFAVAAIRAWWLKYETVLNFIRTTTSTTGFCCQADLDTTVYETGIAVPAEELDQLCLRPHQRFPDWNYTIYPRSNNYGN